MMSMIELKSILVLFDINETPLMPRVFAHNIKAVFTNKKNSEVTLNFKDAKGLLMYRLGQKVIVKLPKSGDYTFKLYPGEGRFIIPLK